jgi:hypothetical protein
MVRDSVGRLAREWERESAEGESVAGVGAEMELGAEAVAAAAFGLAAAADWALAVLYWRNSWYKAAFCLVRKGSFKSAQRW